MRNRLLLDKLQEDLKKIYALVVMKCERNKRRQIAHLDNITEIKRKTLQRREKAVNMVHDQMIMEMGGGLADRTDELDTMGGQTRKEISI
jgi:hypothetical protein